MPDKQRKTKRKFTTMGLLGLMLTGSVLLHTSFGSRPAIAASEQTATDDPAQEQENFY